MKKTVYIAFFWMVLFVIGTTMNSLAQEIIFSAQAAASQVGIQDPFEVQFRIENVKEVSLFQLPEGQAVQVLSGPSRNIQYRDINGHRTVTVILTYVMKARKKGKLLLAPATAVADGHKLHSNAIAIDVVDGSKLQRGKKKPAQTNYDPFEEWLTDDFFNSDPLDILRKQQQMMKQWSQQQVPRQAPPSRQSIKREEIGKNIFFLVETDKRNVYRGEQINVSYKLYTRLPMEISITKTPDLQGFWSQDFKLPNPPQPVKEIYKGKEYQVFEIKRTAIFPTQTGTLTLDQAKAEGVVRLIQGSENGDFFDSFFGSMLDDEALQAFGQRIEEIPIQLQSTPIEIHVNELPPSKDIHSFKGAVGHFNVETNINNTEIKENEAATLTLKISGSGNLKLAGVPTIPFPASLNLFEPVVSDSIVFTTNQLAGYKEIKYTFTPKKTGNINIPSWNFSFFDPNAKSYKTISIPSYTIRVLPNDRTNGALPRDIHDIQQQRTKMQRNQTSIWFRNPWYWAVYSIPFLALIAVFAAGKNKQTTVKNEPLLAHTTDSNPNQLAMARLSRAEQHLHQGDHAAFYQETSKALWLYLSDKLHIPLALLSHHEAEKKLNELAIQPRIVADIFQITKACETALYSPNKGTLHMHQIYSDSIRLIGQLETVL